MDWAAASLEGESGDKTMSADKTEKISVTATVDIEHAERQLLEAVSLPGFGPIASNGLLAVRGLKAKIERLEERCEILRIRNRELQRERDAARRPR